MEDKAGEKNELQHAPSSVVAVGIKGGKKSTTILQWALKRFVPEGRIMFKLIHVHASIKRIPTPMGNFIPISQVRPDVVNAFRKEVEWQKSQMLLPYKNMCDQEKVYVDTVVIESDDVAAAIAEEIAKGAVTKLIIGASSRSIFSSKLKGIAAKISVCTPRFCTVYAISKGKLSSVRPSDVQIDQSFADDGSETNGSTSSSNCTSSSPPDSATVALYGPLNSSSTEQQFEALSSVNQTVLSANPSFIESSHCGCQSLDTGTENNVTISSARNYSIGYGLSQASSCISFKSETESQVHVQNSTLDVLPATESPSPARQENINLELEKLRIELRHAQGMHAIAQNENIDASRKLNDLNKRRSDELMKLNEIIAKEESANESLRQEREKYEAAKRETDYLKECAERETAERREMEMKAIRAAQEKEKLESALTGLTPQYHKFTWDEIVSATSSFSEDLRIGMGAYGTVYKCNLHHTVVAVKVLHSKGSHKIKQFQRELEILSRVRHPNLLLLLGACPDDGCLVYEYMENGSLEDRLLKKNGTAPLPWYERYRIAWEVASALAFLHSSKPTPIIHRDLKPANILLDSNLMSKIGDIGLSTVLNSDGSSTMHKDTEPVGTLCYIDPEYQRTGLLSPKSDVYAFGMVILQLLTAKPAIALTHVVETAVDDGKLTDILDPEAGSWPLQETMDLARLGLSCTELRRRDRPNLDHVIPALERLKEAADKAQSSSLNVKSKPPNHFICPILQVVKKFNTDNI
ncbi:U-box domain-containing protein 35 isoform X2 [Neltuma alba]|uniref:U-box domain-containing protein 35 isoform X2 n=1 Tax=Neltuma alba TaxID=207710 RepID=UPI0010A5210F|nr:U-box domain-containing protein 35-like isoform X2 [Prosopis alba]XP_028804841.1 U-box domain-containing protein 35-like isoform X2 [Prosopis alba]